ncbi:MAG: TetR/AcrR family transcriptional regulator [Desulfobacteraceae bacterium]|nr:TetR/AcrR family transcriptional regulator [Desulfobacteraceae bacterium]
MSSMKQTIRDVSINLFYRKGYFATSISEIAAGCGIQKASIYYHYPGKEDILFGIMRKTMDDLTSCLKKNLQGLDDIEGRMRAAVKGHVRFHLEHQKETFIASSELRGLSEGNYSIIVAKRDAYERILQDLISEGAQKGVFGKNDIKILSYAILTLCTAGASWFKPNGRLSIDEIASIYEEFIISGLKPGLEKAALRSQISAV